jgi:clusterin-associated protein 1
MAYRDIRNLSEIMRQLGYSRRISMENFLQPNFQLVAEILYWMVQRYDPSADISDNIEGEDDRVNFIKSVTQLFVTKARLKINPLKLYQANSASVKEILKIAVMLNKAMNTTIAEDEDSSSVEFNLSNKLYNLKQARQLAGEITLSGAKLYDQLGKEKDLRDARGKALDFLDSISRNLDSNKEQEYIEKCIRDIISTNKENSIQMEKMVENLKTDEATLEGKIKRKRDELERAEKRIKTLENVRPAFMDEYEQLEKELERLYALYVEGIRNMDYLEGELDDYNSKEMEKKAESERKLEELKAKLQSEELRQLKGEVNIDEEAVDEQAQKAVNEMAETRSGFNKQKLAEKASNEEAPEGAKPQRMEPGMKKGALKGAPQKLIEEESPDKGEDMEVNEPGEMGEGDENEQGEMSDSEIDQDDGGENDF